MGEERPTHNTSEQFLTAINSSNDSESLSEGRHPQLLRTRTHTHTHLENAEETSGEVKDNVPDGPSLRAAPSDVEQHLRKIL